MVGFGRVIDGGSWRNALTCACLACLTWQQCALATVCFLAPVAAKMALTDNWQPLIYQA